MPADVMRILFVEDSPEDVEFEERALKKGGLDVKSLRVETPEDLLRALRDFKPDLVISDYSLPGMDGLGALKISKETRPDIPFIFVSGTIGEERAIESLRNGATDYVVKDRLGGFVEKVRRALKEARDLQERRKMEEQLRQAQKMEAIGRLAGGIAHDFNNLLTAILGYAELALEEREGGKCNHEESIREVLSAGKKASQLTKQLLAFSRKQVIAPQVLGLNRIVADLEKMLGRIIGEDVRLVTSLDPALGDVKADPSQVEQIVVNLAVNARDAMPHGGTLTLETRNVDLTEEESRRSPGARPGPFVMLSVADTGHGMDAEILSHLFEPFFTTKGPGKGTGLGLSTVYGIVTQSDGFITVESQLAMGTTFRAYFPRIGEARDTERRFFGPASVEKGCETILVVEDSESVRKLVVSILKASGYKVLVAGDGEEAFSMSESFAGPIHLTVSDAVMPRMGGMELAKLLGTRRPETRILIMSGYTDRNAVPPADLGGSIPYLQKPFTADDLIRKVRQTLDTGGA